MKMTFPDIKANFIVDSQGQKKQVVLDIEQFQELMETLEDFYDVAQSALAKIKGEETISLEELEKSLEKAHESKDK